MGSGGSKASSSRGSKERSKGKTRVFQSSCLGTRSRSRDSDNGDQQVYEPCDKSSNECNQCINQNPTDPDQLKSVSSRKAEIDSLDEPPCISSSDVELQEWDGSSRLDGVPEASSSSSIRASLNPSSRFFSRFSFNPGNVSFRLSRAASLGSSRDYRLPRTNLVVSDTDEDTQQDHESHYSSRVNRNHHQQHNPDTSNNRWSNLASGSFNNQRPNLTISSTADDGRDSAMVHTPVVTEAETGETGPSDRRTGAREHAERNVRFSRTLSVGRLRDRVLRRSSLSESTNCPTESREIGQGSERQISTVGAAVSAGRGNIALSSPSTSAYSPAGLSRALFGVPDHDVDASRPREGTRYRDLLEHRSDFLDRRRRIRSQVRALQRLESRFENLSGHERSCILSGQHRNGRCTCRNGNRDVNTNDDTFNRASISRIVMLAEALFEVLDEIHQQSVVLSSRPSVSSIGSVPAPNEVVDSLPIKLYSKMHKHQNEDAAQCYICLVEYEEGESVRILPCHHEFHRACVDKWLKEIHRVCPLCRGDVCRSELLSTETEAGNHSAV